MKNYFNPTPTTCEELKSAYRKLAMQYHPDCGGDTEIMKTINSEYEYLFKNLKNVHKNVKGETYNKETEERYSEFINIINELIKHKNIKIEIVGSFIWVSGDTKPYREQLKILNFKWSHNKSAWYLAPKGYHRKGGGDYSMDDIRSMYGSKEMSAKENDLATA